jgi:hypothetical protein
MTFEGGKRFRADVMLDAFGIHFRDAFGDAKATEESDNSFVAALASGRERSAFVGEKNRAIWLSGNKACVLEPGYSAIDGDMSYAQAFGEVNDTGFADFCDQVGDGFNALSGEEEGSCIVEGFNLILANLVRMFAACLREILGLAFVAGI